MQQGCWHATGRSTAEDDRHREVGEPKQLLRPEQDVPNVQDQCELASKLGAFCYGAELTWLCSSDVTTPPGGPGGRG